MLDVIQANSLRDIVSIINDNNSREGTKKIVKENIVTLFKDEGTFFLVYYI